MIVLNFGVCWIERLGLYMYYLCRVFYLVVPCRDI